METCTTLKLVSIYDLNNYFKINDLLGGLSSSQQAVLRKNIGVGNLGEGFKLTINTKENSYNFSINGYKIDNNNYYAYPYTIGEYPIGEFDE